eukprot:EG_transcript_43852
MECAAAVGRRCPQPVAMVIQSGQFLLGNLASQQSRSFNLLGPLDWAGQLLLRAGGQQPHVFVTTQEWESLQYKYQCLPYERFFINGNPETVYCVTSPKEGKAAEDEWMYTLAEKEKAETLPLGRITELWQAYSHGRY